MNPLWRYLLGMFDIFLFFLLSILALISQFGFIVHALVGVIYLIIGSIILAGRIPRRLFWFVVFPLSILAVITALPTASSKIPDTFRTPLYVQLVINSLTLLLPFLCNWAYLKKAMLHFPNQN